jgi:putative ABC transport system substrate-binding protein
MRRREFIAGLGSAAAWPVVARAQQPTRMRRIGVLMAIAESDADSPARIAAFQQSLARLGWTLGRNLRIDYRWAGGDVERVRIAVPELLGLAPDAILADGTPALRAIRQATTSIPIVFTVVSEPVAAGFVASLAHPGGNITGFSNLEPGVGAKWLELLQQVSPGVTRATLVFNPDTTPVSQQQSRWARAAAEKLGIAAVVVPVRNAVEIEAAVTIAGRERGGGLILPQDPFTVVHRQLIVELAARHQLPAVYASVTSPPLAVCCPTASMSSISFDRRRPMSIAYFVAQTPRTWRCSSRQSSSWWSTSRPPKPSASPSRKRCWPLQMRLFNEQADVHRGSWERGGVARCGAGAAGRPGAAHRRTRALRRKRS